eukprot:1105015-Amphidinium_carterae.2
MKGDLQGNLGQVWRRELHAEQHWTKGVPASDHSGRRTINVVGNATGVGHDGHQSVGILQDEKPPMPRRNVCVAQPTVGTSKTGMARWHAASTDHNRTFMLQTLEAMYGFLMVLDAWDNHTTIPVNTPRP